MAFHPLNRRQPAIALRQWSSGPNSAASTSLPWHSGHGRRGAQTGSWWPLGTSRAGLKTWRLGPPRAPSDDDSTHRLAATLDHARSQVDNPNRRSPRVHYRRRIIGAALGLLAGVGLLLAGVVVKVILIAVAGLCGHVRVQLVGGGQLPADDGKHHRARPRQGPGPRHEGHAANGRRAGKQAAPGLIGGLEERCWRRQ